MLPNHAFYQLNYTRIWNCFICGLSCGLGRFLTNGFAEMVPASGSVPAGCEVGLFSSWMGPVFSQSRRATNCATPGYGIVLSVVFHVVLAVFSPTALRKWFPLLVVSQRVVGLGFFPHGWAGYTPKLPGRGSGADTPLTLSFYRISRRCQASLVGRALFPPALQQTRTRKCTSPGGSSTGNPPGRRPWRRTARRRRHR